jgi:hypothetical protein
MDSGMQDGGHVFGVGLTLLIVIGSMALRNRRPRKLTLEGMWVRPLIFFVLVAFTLAIAPIPDGPVAMSILAVALIMGCAVGWLRGSLMKIEVSSSTHTITAQASVIGMVFILAILALRMTLRSAETMVAGVPAAAVADGLILFAGAMMITQTIEMFLRARRLLNEARTAAVAEATSSGANPPIVQ